MTQAFSPASAAQDLSQRLLFAVSQAVVATDLAGHIIYWNPAAEDLFGWSADEALGRQVSRIIRTASPREKVAELMRSLRSGSSWTGEVYLLRKDGSSFPAQLRNASIRDEAGEVVGVVGVSIDISAEVEAREQAAMADRLIAAKTAELKKSERRFRSFVDATALVVWAADEAGNVVEVSDVLSELTGVEEESITGWGWLDLLHEEDRPVVEAKWKEHLRLREPIEMEYRVRTLNDTWHWLSARAAPVLDEDGRCVEWLGTCTDVNERMSMESALRLSEESYRMIVDTAHEGVWLIDADARTTFANARMQEMLGYDAEEMLGRRFFEFVDADSREAAKDHFARRRAGQSETYAMHFRRSDGEEIWLLIAGSPFHDAAGQFTGALAMITDITERKRYEEGLIEAKEKAEELSRLKSTLLTNMSHELRTPLTSILGFAQVIAEGATEEMQEYAALLQYSGQRLQDTFTSVLEMAELEAGSVSFAPAPVDVLSLAHETLQSFRLDAQEKGLSLRLQPPNNEAVVVTTDSKALSRILRKLLSNALKFTREGEIVMSVEGGDETVSIEISDTGIGIGEEFLPELFDEFKQESEGLTRSYDGSGLGLSIARRLVSLMGGRIDVRSEKGIGSTFTIHLTRQPVFGEAAEPGCLNGSSMV